MKSIINLFILLSLLMTLSCGKALDEKMTVIRDCTGTYLQKDGKDYQVCNLELVEKFATGSVVRASYKRLNECKGSAMNQIVCMMYHESEGWIEVTSIK